MNATRRRFLTFLGVGTAAVALAPTLAAANGPRGRLTPVRLPHTLPIYAERPSFLATGLGQGTVLEPTIDAHLQDFTVIDDVVVPPEYERYVIVSWGDRVFPRKDDYVGYNNDYTGFVPASGNRSGALWVNHEYVSFPFSDRTPAAPSDLLGLRTSFLEVIGFALPTTVNREFLGEACYNTGGSALQLNRAAGGRYAVVAGHRKNFRLHGLSGLAINAGRTDSYAAVTAWGTRPHQLGDDRYLVGTGPAATDVFEAVNSDGLGNRIIGTSFNCAGATTPWGTIMTAEENFQGSSLFFIGVQESVKPDGSQTGYVAGTSGAEFGQVGEKYGWIVEVDPNNPSTRAKKHTALGRYRHENVAVRVQPRRRLVAYLGDDRRGGHTWKFVSAGFVSDPGDRSNSRLLENGTLYVAKYHADGTGQWIPLALDTPTNPVRPSEIASVEIATLGTAQNNGNTRLPRRAGIAGQSVDGGSFVVTVANEATTLLGYQAKTLADFYPSRGAMLCDAFLAANLVGGTPTARPEDIEIHPDTKAVFIAMTDGAPGSDGYPDSRIFSVAKMSTDESAIQPLGALYKIIEDSEDGTGTTFTWERFLQGGEAGTSDDVGTVLGAGFAAIDNLAFDREGTLWGVTDMSTGLLNGFDEGAVPSPLTITHGTKGAVANLVGVFGNNWLFAVPTRGPNAGRVIPFAYGPMRCEMTGPTFLGGETLLISVQHPGEDVPINELATAPVTRQIELLGLDGTLLTQTQTAPVGSNWPSNLNGNAAGPPRPCTIGIRRRDGRDFSDFE